MRETGQSGPAVIDPGVEMPTAKRTSQVGKLLRATYVDRIGALYVLVLVIILFSVWKPGVFPTWDTARAILNANAITAMVSLALIVPLCAGMFDLSIGNVMALVSVMTAWLIVDEHVGILLAILLVILAAIAVGAFNSLIAVRIGVDSFVATLGTGAVLQAINLLISGNQVVTDPQLNGTFSKIATTSVGGIQVTVFVALATMIAMWWLLEHTVTGRRLYATGFNPEGARLAGVRVRRIRIGAMIVSATVAGIAGLLITSQLGAGSPEIGPSYLLDAFATAFLGATQIKKGRFNAVGTVLAVLLVGTGSAGLTIAGAPSWTLSLFTGGVLLIALVLTKVERPA